MRAEGLSAMIPGTWLVLYGCAVLSASMMTKRGDHALDCNDGWLVCVVRNGGVSDSAALAQRGLGVGLARCT